MLYFKHARPITKHYVVLLNGNFNEIIHNKMALFLNCWLLCLVINRRGFTCLLVKMDRKIAARKAVCLILLTANVRNETPCNHVANVLLANRTRHRLKTSILIKKL